MLGVAGEPHNGVGAGFRVGCSWQLPTRRWRWPLILLRKKNEGSPRSPNRMSSPGCPEGIILAEARVIKEGAPCRVHGSRSVVGMTEKNLLLRTTGVICKQPQEGKSDYSFFLDFVSFLRCRSVVFRKLTYQTTIPIATTRMMIARMVMDRMDSDSPFLQPSSSSEKRQC